MRRAIRVDNFLKAFATAGPFTFRKFATAGLVPAERSLESYHACHNRGLATTGLVPVESSLIGSVAGQ